MVEVVEVPVTQARAELAELLNRVVYGGQRVVLTRHGKPIAGLICAEDLARLEQTDPSAAGQGTLIRLSGGPQPHPGPAAHPAPGQPQRLDPAAAQTQIPPSGWPPPHTH